MTRSSPVYVGALWSALTSFLSFRTGHVFGTSAPWTVGCAPTGQKVYRCGRSCSGDRREGWGEVRGAHWVSGGALTPRSGLMRRFAEAWLDRAMVQQLLHNLPWVPPVHASTCAKTRPSETGTCTCPSNAAGPAARSSCNSSGQQETRAETPPAAAGRRSAASASPPSWQPHQGLRATLELDVRRGCRQV
jgi:hypothetical protein